MQMFIPSATIQAGIFLNPVPVGNENNFFSKDTVQPAYTISEFDQKTIKGWMIKLPFLMLEIFLKR